MSPWRGWKRSFTRLAITLAPIALLYGAAGWSSQAALFKPVKTFRSVVDPQQDSSTYFRHVENWNLAVGMGDAPILGRGFGHEFTEYWHNADILSIFPQYRAEPHNQVLGILLFGGWFGFVGFLAPLVLALFLAARSYRFARDPEDRAAALCCHATIVIALMQVQGDLGSYATQYKVLVALALVLAGKLAVATGAWPGRPAPRPVRPQAAPRAS
jgi:O-antigen ligase